MIDIKKENNLLEQFRRTKTFKLFYSTLLNFDESLNCFVASEKWRDKEAELINAAWWMFEESQILSEACAKRDQGIEGLNSLGVKFFSHDFNGDGFQYHDTLQEAKQAAENDLDIYRDRVADGKHVADMGEFYELSYGLVIASANYSVDTVVSEEHHQNGEYEKYEIGTEILHLYLEEGGVLAQWPQDRQMTGQDVELINAVCAGKSLEFAESFIPEVPKIIEILKAQQAEPENA